MSVLAVAVCAVLAGAATFAAVADWVRDLDRPVWARLGFHDRVPAATRVWRLLIRIDAELLHTVLTRWLRARTTPIIMGGRRWRLVIAIGKVERGARLPDGRQVHLLSAYDTTAGIVLAQVQITAKSNELLGRCGGVREVGKLVGPVGSTPCDLGAGESVNELGAGGVGQAPGSVAGEHVSQILR